MTDVYKLPKHLKLCKNKNFQLVYNQGKSFANKMMVIHVKISESGQGRVGFAAGKRLGNAVIRNRVKRLLREVYRLNHNKIQTHFDLILVGRRPMIKAKYQFAEKFFLELGRHAKIIIKTNE